jgi:hypothetical protein
MLPSTSKLPEVGDALAATLALLLQQQVEGKAPVVNRLLYWDRTGYCLFAKRLERGRFVLPGSEERFELSEQAFRLLLDGIALGRPGRNVV